ncbi:MAG: ABC transporter permease [Tannerella sp.]|jgi:ABC-2 type transport system permease protein|nr:ABC transporter permease [Tannerella sp.]
MKKNNSQFSILNSPFIRKEFLHIFRDRRTMLILLGMPVVQIILFGFAISTEVKNIRVAAIAPVHDEATRRIVERMDASEYFTFAGYLDSPGDVDRAFQEGTADFVVVFSPHFAGRLYTPEGSQIQWIPDATETNTAATVVMYATSIVHDWLGELTATPSVRGVTPSLRMMYNPQMKSSYNFVPGVMGLILILICAMMTSISIVREKETGTMELLLVSPVRPLYLILAKMTPYLVLSLVNFASVLVLSVTLLDMPLEGSLFWVTALSVIYILAALSLGLLISTVARTQMAAMLVSAVVLMLPVIMLSGMIFPVESMPDILQALSCIIPARWYIHALKKLMIEGLPVTCVVRELGILSAMTACLILISLKKFKNRLE